MDTILTTLNRSEEIYSLIRNIEAKEEANALLVALGDLNNSFTHFLAEWVGLRPAATAFEDELDCAAFVMEGLSKSFFIAVGVIFLVYLFWAQRRSRRKTPIECQTQIMYHVTRYVLLDFTGIL